MRRLLGVVVAVSMLMACASAQRVPWVDPETTGAGNGDEFAIVLENTYGFEIGGEEVPATLRDALISAHNNAITQTMYPGVGGPVDFFNVRIHGYWADPTKWGTRAYDAWGYTFRNCTWDTIRVEHGAYIDPVGALLFENCEFDEIMGNAVQIAYAHPFTGRKHETGLIDPRVWFAVTKATVANEWHEVIRCSITNTCRPNRSDRAGFALSFFDPNGPDGMTGHPVRVKGCYFQTSDPYVGNDMTERDCGGAIMAKMRRKVYIEANYIEFLRPDKDVIQLWGNGDGKPGTNDVVLRNNKILANKGIDIRPGNLNDTIIIERNAGTAWVVVSTAPWYEFKPRPEQIIYEGPISQNWRMN